MAWGAELICEFMTTYEIEPLSRVQRANYDLGRRTGSGSPSPISSGVECQGRLKGDPFLPV
jgi:hypothetical protein